MGKRLKRKCTESWECPVEALNPSFGQRVLASLLNDIWTKEATTGQACSGCQGRARKRLALPEETGFFTVGFPGGWRVVPGGTPWWSPSGGAELTTHGDSLADDTCGQDWALWTDPGWLFTLMIGGSVWVA